MKQKLGKAFLVLLMIALGIGYYIYAHYNEVSTNDAMIDGRTVTICPKVAGYVKTLHVKDNQVVKTGDLLVEIDSTDYILRRDRAKAILDSAIAAAHAADSRVQTTLVSAPSKVSAANAQVSAAVANWEKAYNDLERMQRLFEVGACSRQQLDQAVASEQSLKSTLDQMRANLTSAGTAPTQISEVKASSEQAKAQIAQAKAELDQAEADLANTKIFAAMDGKITKCSIEKGSYIQPGQQLATLVGTELWVIANYKETQLEHIHSGQAVDIKVDAFPNLILHGKVDSIQSGTGAYFSLFPSENATGNFVKTVQRLPVKIIFDPIPDEKVMIGPGMSVVPTIYTKGGGDNA